MSSSPRNYAKITIFSGLTLALSALVLSLRDISGEETKKCLSITEIIADIEGIKRKVELCL